MAISRKKGKLLLLLLFVYCFSFLVSDLMNFFPRFSSLAVLASDNLDPPPNSNSAIEKDCKNENPFNENNLFLKKHQIQLEIFQELVQNLTQLVARLESHFTNSPLKVEKLSEPKNVEKSKEENEFPNKEEILPVEGLKNGASYSRGAVLKYNTFWSEKFQFVSAVKLRSIPTCVNVLPYRDHEGLSKYFAVGDDKGKLYVFLRTGDVSLEIDTFSDSEDSSPITAMVSVLSVFKNETMVATGHDNGVIVIHRVWEVSNGDDWNSLRVERLGRSESPGGSRIAILEAHHVGRKRYVLATDVGGKIRVLGDDGRLYGAATPSRRPIAFLKQRLLFLTDTGAGSLDLRTMKLKETECEGLNNSRVRGYAFDVVDRTKAYGFTSEGDLVHTLLLGDVMNFKCRIRSKRKLDMDRPMALQAIRGYLLVSNEEKVFVYNVSTQHYVRAGGPRLMFSVGLDEIVTSFLSQQSIGPNGDGKTALSVPLIAGDYEKVVVMGLGNGYVAMYRSNLPVYKNEFNSILWTSPVLFFVLFLFVAWHFFANKKEALTSWGPDDPFPESSRNSENTEMRGGGGLRSSSRYVSPPRNYGPASSYRPGNDTDPRFRTASELKYRGPHAEGLQRRDGIFVNGQAVDDSRD